MHVEEIIQDDYNRVRVQAAFLSLVHYIGESMFDPMY